MTLRIRLFLAALPVLLLFAIYNSVLLVRHEEGQLLGEMRERAQAEADLLSSTCAYALQTGHPTMLASNVNSAFLQADVEHVAITDPQGRIRASSDPAEIGLESRSDAQEEGTLTVEAPVSAHGQPLGTVQVTLSTAATRVAIAQARQQVWVTSLLLLLAVTVLTVVAAHRLAAPLGVIAQTADEMAEGYLSSRVPLGRNGIRGELVPLAVTFNRMAERLERRVRGERTARVLLAQRVARLLEFTAGVSRGDLTQQAQVFADDDLGRLTDDFNRLVSRMRALLETEQAFRVALERSARDLRDAHARLSLADRQKTDFLVVVSHELRTPLTAVKAFAELLLDGVDDPQQRTEFLGIIQREAERLTRLINNLLDLSRIDAERMNWRTETVSASRLVRAAVETAASAAHAREVRLDVLVADERLLEGDLDRLAQAIGEVIQNAVQVSAAGEAVRISIADANDPDHVGIVVEDRGCGIDPTHHVAIFERFWQVTRPTHGRELERPRGSGLGLPLAKAIVTAHGGSIAVESSTVAGTPTRFTITLPLRQREDRPARLLSFAESYLGRSVDSSQYRDLLKRLLEGPPA